MTTRIARALLLPALVLFTTLAAALEPTAPENVGLSSERLARLTERLEAYAEDGRVAGGVALVARRGHVAYLEAFGERDRESGAPMTTDTIFRIASQTKAIVSVAAMMLQEEGALLISEPVGDYIPEFKQTSVAVPRDDGGYDIVPARRPISIRDLLTHTSGFGYGMGPAADRWAEAGIVGWYFADRDEPIGATVARIAGLPADAQPGERWVYGYNTDILGALIERASGEALDEFLAERIFRPLGMADTHFYLPSEKVNRLAAVYSESEGALVPAEGTGAIGQGAYTQGPRKSFSGGAGLTSTAGDYARFLQMLLNGGELDGERLLGRKTVELMTTSHLADVPFRPGEGFGLGFSIVEDVGTRGVLGSAGEYGWGGAYHSTYWVDPAEELIVVYMTQLLPAGDIDDFAKLRALVYQAIVD
jgi:CubicO group peptidase (beta-lactamase class C family)